MCVKMHWLSQLYASADACLHTQGTWIHCYTMRNVLHVHSFTVRKYMFPLPLNLYVAAHLNAGPIRCWQCSIRYSTPPPFTLHPAPLQPSNLTQFPSVPLLRQFSSVQFSSIQFSLVQFNSVQFCSIQISLVQFNSIQLSSVQFSPVQFNPDQFSTVQLNSVQFNPDQFSSIQFVSVQFSSIQISSVQFNWIQFSSV